MPGQTFTGHSVVRAATPEIWDALDQAATWEGITGVDRVYDESRDESGRLAGFRFDSTAAGRKYIGTAKPGPRVEGKSLSWDIATSEIKGRVTVDLAGEGEDTRIDVTMRVESVSMMASLGFPMIASLIGNGFQKSVDDFAASLSESSPNPPT